MNWRAMTFLGVPRNVLRNFLYASSTLKRNSGTRRTFWISLNETFTAVVLDKVDAATSSKIMIWGDGVGGNVMVQQPGNVGMP